MYIAHVLVGLIVGFVAAVWACAEGYSLLAMLGFYVLAGNLGVAASAAVSWAGKSQQGHARRTQEA